MQWAFGCGPGSFTGIRIAAAVAQAVAFGADARILPVSSTLALATAALEAGRSLGDGVVASIRSRRDAWYLAGFAVTDGELRVRHADCLVTADPGWPEFGGRLDVCRRPARVAGAGNGLLLRYCGGRGPDCPIGCRCVCTRRRPGAGFGPASLRFRRLAVAAFVRG